MKKLLTFLMMSILAIGVGWAKTSTLTFTEACEGSGTADDGVTWTVTSDASESDFDKTKGIHYGTSKAAVSYLKLLTNGIIGTITQIKVNASGASGTSAVCNVTVGGNAFGSQVSLTSSAADYTFTGSASGPIVVSLTQTSAKKALYVKSIVVTYTPSGSPSGVGAPSISFSSFTNGNTSVTATITPGENATSTSYKIGSNGTYQSYSTPVQIDLTDVASPITVYAKSSDGNNESSEASATFTLPALGLSISPASYEGYAAQPVTITPSNYVGDYIITYTINGGLDIDYTEPFTLSDPGTYEIVASVLDKRANGSAVTSNTATITINQGTTYTIPFKETFDGTKGHGGNDGVWSGSTATNTIVYDKPGWSVTQNWGGDACIRLGTSTVYGSITSPTITGLTEGQTYTLTFKAAPWGATSTIMNVTASGATVLGLPTEPMSTGQWNDFELTLTATATSTTITFNSDQNRFWLDEINIAAPLPDGDYYLVGDFNNWTEQDPNYKFTANADGNFILNGVTIADNSKFKIMKGSAWCGGGTDDNQYNVKSDWHTDMNITVGDAGKDYYMASGGICYFTISDRFLLTVQKAPVAIRGNHNSWSETAMTATETGWTIDNLDLVEDNEFQFKDGWGGYHGGGGANISVDYLGVALDMGSNGNYVVKVPGKYTITVNRWLNKMTADVERNTHNITCVATPNGGGSVSATVGGTTVTSAKYVDEVTINTTLGNGYTLSGVVVTGNTSGNTITVTDNIFRMPDEDVTITATFIAGSYAITVVSPHGTTTCPENATVGQTVIFTVTPADEYTVKTVTASFENNNGETTPVPVSYNDQTYEYSFGMPPFLVTVTVTYTKQSSGGGDYVKVTSTTDLTDGDYLIVYEDGYVAFNGALETLDATDNTISVEIDNKTISSTETVDAAVFTYDATAGTFKNANGVYIGRTINDNGLESGTTSLTNTVSIDNDGNAVIVSSGGAYLRYNAANDQKRFRYFKSGSYTNQQAIQLYKKNVPSEVSLDGVTFNADRQWATWYGDANLALPENVTAYVVTGVQDDAVAVESVDYIPANTGVLLYSETAAESVSALPCTSTGTVNSWLEGTLEAQTVSNAYLLYNNQFILAQDGTIIGAHRCYLPANAGSAQTLKIGKPEVVTGVETISADNRADDTYYNLMGQPVTNPAPGIYIRGGKKVIVR